MICQKSWVIFFEQLQEDSNSGTSNVRNNGKKNIPSADKKKFQGGTLRVIPMTKIARGLFLIGTQKRDF